MLITARDPVAPRLKDGILGHATSDDMVTWELQPPLTTPAGFGQLEVPQLRQVDGRWLLVFTCHPEEQSEDQRLAFGDYCTWFVAADSPLGPFDLARAQAVHDRPEVVRRPARPDA